MKYLLIILIAGLAGIIACSNQQNSGAKTEGETMSSISKDMVKQTTDELIKKYGPENKFRIERGVGQAAAFWKASDGSAADFKKFCMENFVGPEPELDKLFARLQTNFETIYGHLREIGLNLRKPVDLEIGEMLGVDQIFAAYDPYAHLTDDFFSNKLAFLILLNFPHYSLAEKTAQGEGWSRKQWAYARMGDIITSRVPAEIAQARTEAMADADAYISGYNIYAGYLRDKDGATYFPKEMKLISHWNLRDEIKSKYSDPNGLKAQRMIYEVMKRIISQEIPQEVINSDKYEWDPVRQLVFKDGKEVKFTPEPNTRYKHLLNNFKASKAFDKYTPYYPTYIQRKFDEEMEIPQKRVEELFTRFVSSPQLKDVAALIKKRLGRELEPFDIWYDGFKSRSSISPEELDKATRAKYPDSKAFAADMPVILKKFGYDAAKAQEISSKVVVEPSRGAGHASGAEMKSALSNLRTRIEPTGMNYKGYNIAVHEFGHNVEQTITIQDVDNYMMKGVPNTAFTEAWAFVFQKRDLELLGMKDSNPDKIALSVLDNFWSTYEIMGVSLVDMNVWKWLYEHPDATEEQLKTEVIAIAKDIWNKYYAPVFGTKDQPILAIYSHMIDYPLYLSAYPIGHIIEFQMEKQIEGKVLGSEMQRMLVQGRLIPDIWMKGAVGKELSIDPTLEATAEAIKYFSGK